MLAGSSAEACGNRGKGSSADELCGCRVNRGSRWRTRISRASQRNEPESEDADSGPNTGVEDTNDDVRRRKNGREERWWEALGRAGCGL
ncbi:hypothetical protein HPP92_018550 [Vanilla planifolia]|uniref:Uncharacterized protein n=1 Tax=Vanilla planifolia TaxID=51239 RepID=A0A835UPH8_VANPL|nr:hypothetical protein HPP92_018550 [Vanilla planifolia]